MCYYSSILTHCVLHSRWLFSASSGWIPLGRTSKVLRTSYDHSPAFDCVVAISPAVSLFRRTGRFIFEQIHLNSTRFVFTYPLVYFPRFRLGSTFFMANFSPLRRFALLALLCSPGALGQAQKPGLQVPQDFAGNANTVKEMFSSAYSVYR